MSKLEKVSIEVCSICGAPLPYCFLFDHDVPPPDKGNGEEEEKSRKEEPMVVPKAQKGKQKAKQNIKFVIKQRSKRKAITIIQNLDHWLDEKTINDLCKCIKKKLALGCAVINEGGSTCLEIQGSVAREAAGILEKDYKVPRDKMGGDIPPPPPPPETFVVINVEQLGPNKWITEVRDLKSFKVDMDKLLSFLTGTLKWIVDETETGIMISGRVGSRVKDILTGPPQNIPKHKVKMNFPGLPEPAPEPPQPTVDIHVKNTDTDFITEIDNLEAALNSPAMITKFCSELTNIGIDPKKSQKKDRFTIPGDVGRIVKSLLSTNFGIKPENLKLRLPDLPAYKYILQCRMARPESATVITTDSPSFYVLSECNVNIPDELVVDRRDIIQLLENAESIEDCDIIAKIFTAKGWSFRNDILKELTVYSTDDTKSFSWRARFIAYVSVRDKSFGDEVAHYFEDKCFKDMETHDARFLGELSKFTKSGVRIIDTRNACIRIMDHALNMLDVAWTNIFFSLAMNCGDGMNDDNNMSVKFRRLISKAKDKHRKTGPGVISSRLEHVIDHFSGKVTPGEVHFERFQEYTKHLMSREDGDMKAIVNKVKAMVHNSNINVDVAFVLGCIFNIQHHSVYLYKRLAQFVQIYSQTEPVFGTMVVDILMERINLSLETNIRSSVVSLELKFLAELALVGVVKLETIHNTLIMILCAGQKASPVEMIGQTFASEQWVTDSIVIDLVCYLLELIYPLLQIQNKFQMLADVFYWVQFFALVRSPIPRETLHLMRHMATIAKNRVRLYRNTDALMADLQRHRNEWIEGNSFPYALGKIIKRARNDVIIIHPSDETPIRKNDLHARLDDERFMENLHVFEAKRKQAIHQPSNQSISPSTNTSANTSANTSVTQQQPVQVTAGKADGTSGGKRKRAKRVVLSAF